MDAVSAMPLWVGGGRLSDSVTFFGDSVSPRNRTPEDTEKLVELERPLESMGISMTPKAKFELLCSASYRGYPVEPPGVAERKPPPDRRPSGTEELISVFQEVKKNLRNKRKSEERSPWMKQGREWMGYRARSQYCLAGAQD